MRVYNSVYPLYYILNVIDILVNIYIFDDRRIFFLFFFLHFLLNLVSSQTINSPLSN